MEDSEITELAQSIMKAQSELNELNTKMADMLYQKTGEEVLKVNSTAALNIEVVRNDHVVMRLYDFISKAREH